MQHIQTQIPHCVDPRPDRQTERVGSKTAQVLTRDDPRSTVLIIRTESLAPDHNSVRVRRLPRVQRHHLQLHADPRVAWDAAHRLRHNSCRSKPSVSSQDAPERSTLACRRPTPPVHRPSLESRRVQSMEQKGTRRCARGRRWCCCRSRRLTGCLRGRCCLRRGVSRGRSGCRRLRRRRRAGCSRTRRLTRCRRCRSRSCWCVRYRLTRSIQHNHIVHTKRPIHCPAKTRHNRHRQCRPRVKHIQLQRPHCVHAASRRRTERILRSTTQLPRRHHTRPAVLVVRTERLAAYHNRVRVGDVPRVDGEDVQLHTDVGVRREARDLSARRPCPTEARGTSEDLTRVSTPTRTRS